MIKLCKNLFYKPKYGSDADSIMLKKLFSTVTVVLVCLAAISLSAYAFFSYSVTSGSNTIQSSSFSASVTIKDNSKDTPITQGKIDSYTFDPGTYTVTINTDDGTTGTGFCVVCIGDVKYYTQQLGRDLNAPGQERKEVRFALDVKAAATVQFEIRWGTNSNYNASTTENKFYITNADPLQVITVNAVQGVADNNGETESKETEPEGSTESTTEGATESATQEGTVPTTDSGETVHIVQTGESLNLIAKKYDTSYAIVAAYNKLDDPRVIQPGQKIRIPPADWEMPEATTSQPADTPLVTPPETSAPTEQAEPAETTGGSTLDEETQPAVETTEIPTTETNE